ncbi:MAG: ribosome maturation factor RimM [Bacilli bacterium]|nr:ribosome maturation factor RimM [Bacilli bacterium]
MIEYICIGKIVNTHGIKGELRLLSDFEYKDKVFVKGMKIYVGRKKELEVINSYRHHKCFEMITLRNYFDINQVLKYKGLSVYIDKNDLVLDDNQILDRDLIGLNVYVDEVEHGIVTAVRDEGNSNKIIEIEYNYDIVLIPYNDVFVKNINIKEKRIDILPIEGMF